MLSFERRDPRWRDATGVRKRAKGKFQAWFNEENEYVGTFSTLSAARYAWNEKARQWNATVADPCEKFALWDVPPEDMLSFERRDPRGETPPA